MRLLFLSDNFPPEVNAPASRTYEHCLEWVKQGVDVTVITCFPNFPRGEVFSGYKNKLYQKETINGIRVIRVWSYIAANSGFSRRISDFVSYALMAFLFGILQRFDVVIGTSPQFFTAVSARFLGCARRKPWVMEVRDLWPESIAAVGTMRRSSKVYRFLEIIERQLYRSSKAIVVNAEGLKTSIEKKGILQEKIKVIKNGVMLSDYGVVVKDKFLLKKLNLEEKFIVSYIGTMGMAHALDFILDCANEITDKKIHFIMIGEGAERENLMHKAKNLKLDNVTFLSGVPKEEVKNYIGISNVSLVNLKKSDTFKKIIPSKIFENVALKKPILLGVEGESKALIQKYQVGICYEPENKKSFYDALNEIANLDNQQLSDNCDLMIKNFDRSKLAREMLDFIKINI
ncbi:glycosyltransferase family 4 protein [Verrucomicrobiales bacterium]|nr:glycosyltransferase family 4 protein [Verrucomicrobiales bacterium]